ncbi:MAG: extracellular solute-binding protein [Clostridia bacterium]|nr:extracellular solute-binding protein [Clostridia bacterium]
MKNLIKALSLLLALTMFTAILAACGGVEDPVTENTVTEPESLETSVIDHIPVKDFSSGGKPKDITVLVRDGQTYTQEIWVEKATSDPVDFAVFNRNAIILDTFGIDVNIHTVNSPDESELARLLRISVDSNDQAYDLVYAHTLQATMMAADGYLYNIYDLPVVDFTKDWWNRDIMDALSIGGALYTVANDSSLHSMQYSWAMVFNKRIAEKYDIENIYDLVLNGKWTVDKLYEFSKNLYADDGNGIPDIKDQYGLGINWWGGCIALMYAQDQMVTKKDNEGYPYIDFATEKMNNIVQNIYDIMYTDNCCLTPRYMPNVYSAFTEGRVLFAQIVMNETDLMCDMADDFGIIPMPKYDEAQKKYLSLVDGHANIICVPRNIQDPELIGTVLESMAALSHNTVVPAYYEQKLKGMTTRAPEDYDMLELIMDGRVYDFGYIYDLNGLAFIIYQLMEGQNTNFSSMYAEREPGAYNKLIGIIETFKKNK